MHFLFGHVSSVPGKSVGGVHKTSDNNLTIIFMVRVAFTTKG
jgi:hypothetical protein